MSREIVERYFAACGETDPAAVAACFTTDAVVYDTNHPPVRGAAEIGVFWDRIRAKWAGARWTVDSYVGDGDRAAIEWSMHGTHDGEPFVVRGSEHYRFADGRIAEIRQYWTFDPAAPGSELVGYPYPG